MKKLETSSLKDHLESKFARSYGTRARNCVCNRRESGGAQVKFL